MVGFVLEKDETVTVKIPSLFEACHDVTIALSKSRDTRITFSHIELACILNLMIASYIFSISYS